MVIPSGQGIVLGERRSNAQSRPLAGIAIVRNEFRILASAKVNELQVGSSSVNTSLKCLFIIPENWLSGSELPAAFF